MTTTPEHQQPLDFDRLMAEINEEVRRRRQAGDFPPGIERELDEIFAEFAPRRVSLDDLGDLMAKAEEASFLDSDAPTTSMRQGGAVVKKSIARGVGWYVRYLAQNATVFASTVTRILRLLDTKIEVSNEVVFRQPATVDASAATAPAEAPDLTGWHAVVIEALTGVSGRVLHAESGDGSLVGALIGAGVDAYGVEPSETLALGSASTALDVRIDEALPHLRSLPDEGLAAVVLSGCVDRLAPFHQLELARLVAAKTARNGFVIVVGQNPAVGPAGDVVRSDLAPGRRLHPETWKYLLERNGLVTTAIHWQETSHSLLPFDDGGAGAAAFNENLEHINRMLFPSPSYAVVASTRGT